MKNEVKQNSSFSDKLEAWLKSKKPKTLTSLDEVFADKSFAITILLLMFIPALPLPTGGITHIFEIITVLLALEMLVGRRTIWLPSRWKNMKLGAVIERRAIPMILHRIRWFEKHSSQKFNRIFQLPLFTQLNALVIIVFTAAAFMAPPFSGLDTLPALGVVLLCLSVILEDAKILILGYVSGVAGTAIVVAAGAATINIIHRLF
ncbi:MAG: exopolysaccharide biosynthesis protein [bacterium]|nr:exopolysaccharide biosynthesis protein [bacterium]